MKAHQPRHRHSRYSTKFVGYDLSQKINGSEFVDQDEFDLNPGSMLNFGRNEKRMFFTRYATWSVRKRMDVHLSYIRTELTDFPLPLFLSGSFDLVAFISVLGGDAPVRLLNMTSSFVFIFSSCIGLIMAWLMLGSDVIAESRPNPADRPAWRLALVLHTGVTTLLYLAWLGLSLVSFLGWMKLAQACL